MANLVKKYPVPLIFKKILKDNLSGLLVVKGENFTKRLFFSKKELQFAASDLAQERLGEILYMKGKLTREQFIMLHKMKDNTNDKLGKLLVQQRILDKQGLFAALQDQVKTIAFSTFSMASGEWSFTVEKPKISINQKFKINFFLAGMALAYAYFSRTNNRRQPKYFGFLLL